MKKKISLLSLSSIILLLQPALSYRTTQAGSMHPIQKVHTIYKNNYINTDLYELPSELTDTDLAFSKKSYEEKEILIIDYFQTKRTELLKEISQKELKRYLTFVLVGAITFLLTLYFTPLGKIIWLITKLVFTRENDRAPIKTEMKKLVELILHISSFTQIPLPNPLNRVQQDGQQLDSDITKKAGLIISCLTLYYITRYAGRPILWFIQQIQCSWVLYKYKKEPFYNSVANKAEFLFVSSLHLLNAFEKAVIIPSLIDAHMQEDEEGIEDLEDRIRAFRALPKSVKTIPLYTEEAFQREFGNYTKKQQEFIRGYIALMIVVTESIKNGQKNPLDDVPFKPILLVGDEGIGKTNLIEAMSRLTGISLTRVSFNGQFRSEFNGKTNNKNIYGLSSAYLKGLRGSAFKNNGINHQNQILLIDGIDENLDDKMAVKYLNIFLDPRVKKVQDAYVQVPIAKLPFIFATASSIPNNTRLRDRFWIVHFGKIKPKQQKKIIRKQIPKWAHIITSYTKESKKDVMAYLIKKSEKFIERREKEGSMRSNEEEMGKVVMSLSTKIIEKKRKKEEQRRAQEKQEKKLA